VLLSRRIVAEGRDSEFKEESLTIQASAVRFGHAPIRKYDTRAVNTVICSSVKLEQEQ
jgi:hypothetical protein